MKRLSHHALRLGVAGSLLLPATALGANQQAKGLDAVGGDAAAGASTAQTQINALIDTIFYIAGTLAVIVLITGGVMYISSTGDSGRIKTAKDTIFYAIAGLVVVLLARVIIGFVVGRFIGGV